MKKILSLGIISVLSLTLLTGCKSTEDSNVVNISILNSKPEIFSQLESVSKDFMSENKDINIKLVKYSQTSLYTDKLSSMIYADNAPTLTLVDSAHISIFEDSCLDLSSEEWINSISGGVPSIAKNDDDQIIAFPFATEGMGFIYNKKVIDEAGIDLAGINTISSLEEAFKKINAIGKEALIITNEEWSLGDHFLATMYSVDSKKSGLDGAEYFQNIKNNSELLKTDETVNGLIDTFDVMKKYNMYSDSPLTPSYEKCSEVIGRGEVGFWYMGNWAAQSILASSDGNNEFGFIPVPISNNSSDFGNNEVVMGVTKYFIINKDSSLEQQEAAKKFLNYLVYTENGNKFIVEDCSIIPAFDNIETSFNDPLSNDLINYRNNQKSIELMNGYLPIDNSKILGSALKKYLNNEITRENLLQEISDFWGRN